MRCATCDKLLDLYDESVKIYSRMTAKVAGALGDDFTLALSRAQTARDACQEASDKLMEHWRSDHKPGGGHRGRVFAELKFFKIQIESRPLQTGV